jgi:hypothetical protein
VSPLIFERSVQAQFLIPMAAALGLGIVLATAILMLIVPALASIQCRMQERLAGGKHRRPELIEPVAVPTP